MAIEAQKMMALSIGKLTQSRTKRSGVSLHRNLLVSTVLFKARNVIIKEKIGFFQNISREEVSSDEEEPQQVPEMEDSDDESEEDIPSQVGLGNPLLPCVSQTVAEIVDNTVEDKENSPPVVSVSQSDSDVKDKSEAEKCGKCLKRRSEGDSDECKAPKRAKSDSESDNVFVEFTPESKSCSREEPEPMQTEPISSLVNRFSNSFTGLLSSNSQNILNCEQKSQESSLISCSTQIQQAFDTLARPILALAV